MVLPAQALLSRFRFAASAALVGGLLVCGAVQASYLFDADGEVIKSADDAITDRGPPLTLSCIGKLASWNNTGFEYAAGIGNSATSTNNAFYIGRRNVNDQAYATTYISGAASADPLITASADEYDGVWVHLLATLDTDFTTTFYFDGTSQSEVSGDTGTAFDVLTIGNQAAGTTPWWNGRVAECGFYDAVLSAPDIAALQAFTEPGCVASADLIAYYPLDSDDATPEDEGPNGGPTLTVSGATYDADHPTMTGCGGLDLIIYRRLTDDE